MGGSYINPMRECAPCSTANTTSSSSLRSNVHTSTSFSDDELRGPKPETNEVQQTAFLFPANDDGLQEDRINFGDAKPIVSDPYQLLVATSHASHTTLSHPAHYISALNHAPARSAPFVSRVSSGWPQSTREREASMPVLMFPPQQDSICGGNCFC